MPDAYSSDTNNSSHNRILKKNKDLQFFIVYYAETKNKNYFLILIGKNLICDGLDNNQKILSAIYIYVSMYVCSPVNLYS